MFNTFLVEPMYNFLVFLLDVVPFSDLGVAVIILTVVVRTIIFPISKNAIRSQIKMKQIQEPLKEIQTKYKDDQQTMAKEMMKLYKDNNVKPFSSMLLIIIQLPIIFALYFVFLRGGLPEINNEMLYSFINIPSHINPKLLGLIDITSKSLILAAFAGITQLIQTNIMFKKNEILNGKKKESAEPSIMDDMMKSMQVQMKYVLPVIMGVIAYTTGALIALYFTVSNIFSIFQEIYIKNKLIKENNK
jgi:YidC/Oxa1 family membrane protein insertase